MSRPPLLAVLVLVLLLGAGPGTSHGETAPESSLLSWIDALTAALLPTTEGPVAITVRGGRGIDDRKAEVVFLPRLRQALAQADIALSPTGTALEITLSLEGDRVWAVGLLAGEDGPLAIVADWPVDRELEAVLGTRPARAGQGRWSMERLGTLPSPVLALAMSDLDGDGADDLVVLSVDGLRTLLWSSLDRRPLQDGPLLRLPAEPPWGRQVAGWLAVEDGVAHVATTAGHRLEATLAPRPTRWRAGPPELPLSQPPDPSRTAVLWARSLGGPTLALPTPEAPLRDAQLWPGRDDRVLWVAEDGAIRGQEAGAALPLPAQRVGDRIVLADLDGDGRVELVTTASSAPGEADRVRILGVASPWNALPVLFEGEVSGPITALAAGDLDFDGHGDLVFAEQTAGAPVLWRVRRRQ